MGSDQSGDAAGLDDEPLAGLRKGEISEVLVGRSQGQLEAEALRLTCAGRVGRK